MPYTLPRLEDLFSSVDPNDAPALASRLALCKSAVADSEARTERGEFTYLPGRLHADRPATPEMLLDQLTKSVNPDVLAAVAGQVDQLKGQLADLGKDLSLTSPLSTGLIPYDLEAPAKLLTPRPTPLRNRLPRLPGQGTTREFRRILGFTGTGTGGVGYTTPFLNDSSTMTSGSLTLRRGQKISYAADKKNVNYKQQGLSDVVIWSAQFAGQGFQDHRQLSRLALLNASMLVEERALLYARGTDSVFSGAISAPSTLTMTQRAAAAGEVGLQGGRYWVKLTSENGDFGESVLSASIDLDTVTAGNVIDVKVGTEPTGATGYRVYAARVAAAGADPGDALKFFQGRTGYNTFVLQGNPLIVTGKNASLVAADSSASADAYDGMLPALVDPAQSGYTKRLNATLSTLNPATELQAALAQMWDAVKADPDECFFNGYDRVQQSDAIKTGNPTAYRLTITQDQTGGVTVGDVVTSLWNEVTGKRINFTVHPWLAQGNVPIISWSLPIPDSEVSNTFEVHNVQDYMAIDWPVIQHTYDTSTYWFGALVSYAPAWSGCIQGIKRI